MEPEGSLPRLQVPATCPYPEPHESNPRPYIPLPARRILILKNAAKREVHIRLQKRLFVTSLTFIGPYTIVIPEE